jgi:hypothetical protein
MYNESFCSFRFFVPKIKKTTVRDTNQYFALPFTLPSTVDLNFYDDSAARFLFLYVQLERENTAKVYVFSHVHFMQTSFFY